ncbi:MAG: hypothetical protein ABWK00_02160 [Desulfurococcaceae archaeon]
MQTQVAEAAKKKIRVVEPPELFTKLQLIINEYTKQIYEYNNIAKQRSYYLKPVHITVRTEKDGSKSKYYYYGRYWYKLERDGGRIRWIYLGKAKPDPSLPDPPRSLVEGLVLKVKGNEIEAIFASQEQYNEIMRGLAGLEKAR